MRSKIYDLVKPGQGGDKITDAYDYLMITVILASLIPLAFKSDNIAFLIIDKVCVVFFIADYFLRWITADFKFNKKTAVSFIIYPFSPMAIIDLISILPSLTVINNGFKVLRVLRMIKAFRVFRIFKALRYSKSVEIILNVLKKSKEPLIAVGTLAIGYILISALVVFNVEPETFNNFFDAVYWATVSLTTVGYGDIYPITSTGRIVTMVSSFFGIAIVALPAGIITAGYVKEINTAKDDGDKTE